MNKALSILTITLFYSLQVLAQNVDSKTQNIIKAKFYGAEDFYSKSNYTHALQNIEEIESLLDEQPIATVQNLKVKCQIALKQFEKAKKSLDILYSINPSDKILQDISRYEHKITDGIKADALAKEEAREKARLAKIAKEEAEEKKKRIEQARNYFKLQVLDASKKTYTLKYTGEITLTKYEEKEAWNKYHDSIEHSWRENKNNKTITEKKAIHKRVSDSIYNLYQIRPKYVAFTVLMPVRTNSSNEYKYLPEYVAHINSDGATVMTENEVKKVLKKNRLGAYRIAVWADWSNNDFFSFGLYYKGRWMEFCNISTEGVFNKIDLKTLFYKAKLSPDLCTTVYINDGVTYYKIRNPNHKKNGTINSERYMFYHHYYNEQGDDLKTYAAFSISFNEQYPDIKVSPPSSGMIAVYVKHFKLYGFLPLYNKRIFSNYIKPQYISIKSHFKNGVAEVQKPNGKWVKIDKDGKTVK